MSTTGHLNDSVDAAATSTLRSLNIVPSFRYRERQTAELWERNTIRCGAVDIKPALPPG